MSGNELNVSHIDVSEFLYIEPDTGLATVMIADQDGFRPAFAHEISGEVITHLEMHGYPFEHHETKGEPSLVTWAHDQVDAFCEEFAHSFCLDQSDDDVWDEGGFFAPSPC